VFQGNVHCILPVEVPLVYVIFIKQFSGGKMHALRFTLSPAAFFVADFGGWGQFQGHCIFLKILMIL
jgi:hypothetical protein